MSVQTVLNGLKKLEYRGYDSAGIAGIKEDKVVFVKELAKYQQAGKRSQEMGLELDIAIAQTRWATHGKPTKINAHPHVDMHQSLALSAQWHHRKL